MATTNSIKHAIRAIVFDVGGVLADNLHWYEGWGVGTFDSSLQPTVEAVRLQAWNRIREDPEFSELEFWKQVLAAAKLEERFTPQECDDILRRQFRPHFSTLSLAQRLSSRGYSIAICSNHSKAWFDEIFSRFRFADVFKDPQLVVPSYAVGCAKPSHSIFNVVMERLRVVYPDLTPDQVVLVDDQRKNTTSAESFGMHAILFDADVQSPTVLVQALHELGVSSLEIE